ncbi:DUF1684 domain-containing protein [Oerskovia turbata]
MITELHVVDWRRRVHALYSRVRDVAAEDPAAAHAYWVAARDDLFAEHPASPLLPEDRASFTGLPVGPYDPAMRFEAPLSPDPARGTPDAARLDVPTGTDGVVPFERVGRLDLPGLGSLDVWALRSYGGGLFVPVKDRSPATYGGGRYLLDTVKGADLGSASRPGPDGDAPLVVDLNFAYNPSCAYDPAWACPLAPPGNTLAVELGCGELVPRAG